jgi:hypothetical protein
MATFNPAQHSHHLSALRAQLAGPGRATSPIESFSFGNKQEDEVRTLLQLSRSALLLLFPVVTLQLCLRALLQLCIASDFMPDLC